MKLYHSQFTRSGRARWMLEECGATYEIEHMSLMKGDGKKPEYRAIHPHGYVPAFVEGDLKLIESSAILMHLADKFADKKLAPAPGTDERAKYYQWMVYVPATLDPVLETLTLHTRLLPEDKRLPALVEQSGPRLASIAKVVEAAVDGRKFLIGDSFTAADIALASAIGWMAFLGKLGDYPKLAAYHKTLSERPAYIKAYAD